MKYFADQLEYCGDLRHALAAYNAGPTAVKKNGGLPDYPETINYVNRIMAAYLGGNGLVDLGKAVAAGEFSKAGERVAAIRAAYKPGEERLFTAPREYPARYKNDIAVSLEFRVRENPGKLLEQHIAIDRQNVDPAKRSEVVVNAEGAGETAIPVVGVIFLANYEIELIQMDDGSRKPLEGFLAGVNKDGQITRVTPHGSDTAVSGELADKIKAALTNRTIESREGFRKGVVLVLSPEIKDTKHILRLMAQLRIQTAKQENKDASEVKMFILAGPLPLSVFKQGDDYDVLGFLASISSGTFERAFYIPVRSEHAGKVTKVVDASNGIKVVISWDEANVGEMIQVFSGIAATKMKAGDEVKEGQMVGLATAPKDGKPSSLRFDVGVVDMNKAAEGADVRQGILKQFVENMGRVLNARGAPATTPEAMSEDNKNSLVMLNDKLAETEASQRAFALQLNNADKMKEKADNAAFNALSAQISAHQVLPEEVVNAIVETYNELRKAKKGPALLASIDINNTPIGKLLSQRIGTIGGLPLALNLSVRHELSDLFTMMNMMVGTGDLYKDVQKFGWTLQNSLGVAFYIRTILDIYNGYRYNSLNLDQWGGIFVHKSPLDNIFSLLALSTTEIYVNPKIVQGIDKDGKPYAYFDNEKSGRTFKFIPAEAWIDGTKTILRAIPGIRNLVDDKAAFWEDHRVYVSGGNERLYFMDALKNDDAEVVYVIQRGLPAGQTIKIGDKVLSGDEANKYEFAYRYDLKKLRATGGKEGKEIFAVANKYMTDKEGKFIARDSIKNPLEPLQSYTIPSRARLGQAKMLSDVYRGYDEIGPIVAAQVHPLTGAILKLYRDYESLPSLMSVKGFERDGQTIFFAREQINVWVDPSVAFGTNSDGTKIHPHVVFSSRLADNDYLLFNNPASGETAHVYVFDQNGAFVGMKPYTGSVKALTMKGLEYPKDKDGEKIPVKIRYVIEPDRIDHKQNLSRFALAQESGPKVRTKVIHEGFPVVTGGANLDLKEGQFGILQSVKGRVPLIKTMSPSAGVKYFYSFEDVQKLAMKIQDKDNDVAFTWVYPDGKTVEGAKFSAKDGKTPPVTFVVGGPGVEEVGIVEYGAAMPNIAKEISEVNAYGAFIGPDGKVQLITDETKNIRLKEYNFNVPEPQGNESVRLLRDRDPTQENLQAMLTAFGAADSEETVRDLMAKLENMDNSTKEYRDTKVAYEKVLEAWKAVKQARGKGDFAAKARAFVEADIQRHGAGTGC